MSRACRALLTSGSTTVPGANYFVKYVLRVLQHLCTPCNACLRENCVYMSKSRQLRPERDTAVVHRGPSENCMYMSKSRQLRRERACSAGGAWWLCSCPQGRVACSARSQCSPAPVQDFFSLLSTMFHAAFVPQSVPATPHPPHRVRPHVVPRRQEGPECGGGFSSEAANMYVCSVGVARGSRVASSCAAGDFTPSLQPGTMPGGSLAWRKCMIKRRRAIIRF